MGSPPYLVLNRVIDSLHVRVGSTVEDFWPSVWLNDELPRWEAHKLYTDWDSPDLEVKLPTSGLTFTLFRSGHRCYRYWLQNPEVGDIYIVKPCHWPKRMGRQTGALYVDFRSVFLQTHDLDMVRSFLTSLESDFFMLGSEECWRKVARMDVAVDVQLPEGIRVTDLDQFVTRARKLRMRTEHEEQVRRAIESLTPLMDNKGGSNPGNLQQAARKGRAKRAPLTLSDSQQEQVLRLVEYCQSNLESKAEQTIFDPTGLIETLDIGQKSSPLHAQIYRKDKEIIYSGKEFLRDIWTDRGWDGESPVYRVEFRMSGDYLKECFSSQILGSDPDEPVYDLRDMETAIAAIPNLWTYLTSGWCRRLNRSGVKRTEDAAVHPWWAVVQDGWPNGEPVARVRSYAPKEIELIKQINGCLLTYAVKRGSDNDCSSAMEALEQVMGFIASDEFLEKFHERRRRLGLAVGSQWDKDYPGDTEFANQLRRQRIMEFKGS